MAQPRTSLLRQTVHGFSPQLVAELSALKGEPPWLRQRRLAAWKVYQETPLPTREDEEWRRTDISGLPWGQLLAYAESSVRALPSLDGLPRQLQALFEAGEASAGDLIQQDSEVVYACLAQPAAEDGVIFCSLEEAAREHAELAQPYLLGEAFPPQRGKFAALNAALFSGGTFLYVPAGVEVVLPLRATRWLQTAGLAVFPHTVIVLEAGAKATFVEEFFSSSLEGRALVCPGSEVYLKAGAHLYYIGIQQLDKGAYVLGTHRHLIGKDARLDYLTIALGGQLTKSYTDAVLGGEGGSAHLLGVVLGDGRQHFDHQTLQEHLAANASSDLLFRVAVTDSAMSVHYGTVRVHKGAQGTDAAQVVRNLILSERAKAHPILPLEIEASDIKRCSHAAAIGQIDEEQLFYLMSRGLSRRQASKMVVDGFFQPVMAAIPLDGVRRRLRRAIDAKLPLD